MTAVDLFLQQYLRICEEFRLSEQEITVLWERLKQQASDAEQWKNQHPEATIADAHDAIRAMTLHEIASMAGQTTHGTPVARKRNVVFLGDGGVGKSATLPCLTGPTTWRPFQHDTRINVLGPNESPYLVDESLRAADASLFWISGRRGIDLHTEARWKKAENQGLARLFFVDELQDSWFEKVVAGMIEALNVNAVPLQLPVFYRSSFESVIDIVRMEEIHCEERKKIRPRLREWAEHHRRKLIEALGRPLWKQTPSAGELKRAIRIATITRSLVPVLCGAAAQNIGMQQLLDAIVDYLPSPADVPPLQGLNLDHQNVERHATDKEPLAARCFKIETDPYLGHLAHTRLHSGWLRCGVTIFNSTRRKIERVGKLVHLDGHHRREVLQGRAGDVVILSGLHDARVGDVLCDLDYPVVLGRTVEPSQPQVQCEIFPRRKTTREQLWGWLRNLMREDPSLTAHASGDYGFSVQGTDELQLWRAKRRLDSELDGGVKVLNLSVLFKETLVHVIVAEVQYTAFTALVFIEPRKEAGFGIAPSCNCAVAEGIMDALRHRVTAVRATHDRCAFEPFDAIRNSALEACSGALRQASTALVEPFMLLEVFAEMERNVDVITADLEKRRAEIQHVKEHPTGAKVIRAIAPLAQLLGYSSGLKRITDGRASCQMLLYEYREFTRE
jgi:elongation factor G